MRTALIAVAVLALAAAGWLAYEWTPHQVTFFVAPDGDDSNAGTKARPFATLQRAQMAVRETRPHHSREVIVRGGTYPLADGLMFVAEDGGTAERPVTWRAATGEPVRLSGGEEFAGGAFRPVQDPAIVGRLGDAARGHVLEVDLRDGGRRTVSRPPNRFRGAPPLPELFFNDVRMSLARWPNDGWAHVVRVVDPGANPRDGDASGRGGTFEYDDERVGKWARPEDVWLQGYWRYDWYDEALRVAAIDPAAKRVTFAEPHWYSLAPGNPGPRRYRALNVIEELDQPGEYVVDYGSGRLFFWPPADPVRARIVVAFLRTPLIQVFDAGFIHFDGFILEAGLGDGIAIRRGEGMRVAHCQVRNLRGEGIRVTGGRRHRIEACEIFEVGRGAITVDGGDRRTLSPGGHEVVDNHLFRFARHQRTYAAGISLAGVGNRAAHNRIHDAPHVAIMLGGNDHVVELNEIYDVCTETDDAGALYKGRNPSARGNIIRHNFWHHIGSTLGHGTAAIYFDDGDGGDAVLGNIFYRCGHAGAGSFGAVFSHGGHDLRAENNIFIECPRALGSSPWSADRWWRAVSGDNLMWPDRLLRDVNVRVPPFSTRYPDLARIFDWDHTDSRQNHAVRNVMVRVGQASNGNWNLPPDENLNTADDPGFVDAAAGDFRLRSDSVVWRRLPAFAAIPWESIGPRVAFRSGAPRGMAGIGARAPRNPAANLRGVPEAPEAPP